TNVAARDWKKCGQVRDEAVHDRVDCAAQNRAGRATHSGIAEKSRPPREDLFVCRLHMSVSADNSRNPSIEKTSKRDFLAGRLSVSIHENGGCLLTHLLDRDLNRMKRIFENRLHEGPTLHVDDAHRPFCGFKHNCAAAGRAVRIIHWTQQARLRVDEAEDFLLVPDVIASRNDGDARAQELEGDFRSNSPATRSVLAVDDNEIERV